MYRLVTRGTGGFYIFLCCQAQVWHDRSCKHRSLTRGSSLRLVTSACGGSWPWHLNALVLSVFGNVKISGHNFVPF